MEKPIQKKGYQFEGWYIDQEYTKKINPSGRLPHTMTLYDKWVPIHYPITYNCGQGVNSRKNPRFSTIESSAILLYPAKYPGMIFAGWYDQDQKVTTIPEQLDHPMHLIAKFREPCTVYFETGYGANIYPKKVNDQGFLEEFASPMRLGYTFKGWFWDPDCRLSFTFDQPIHEECTLYAKWELTDYHIHYILDGGITSRKNPKSYTYYDPTITLLPASKKGYTFIGWFDQRNNPLDVILKNSIGDKTLVAHYKKNK